MKSKLAAPLALAGIISASLQTRTGMPSVIGVLIATVCMVMALVLGGGVIG